MASPFAGARGRNAHLDLFPFAWVFLDIARFSIAVGNLCCLLVLTSANLLTLIFPNKWQEQSHGQFPVSYAHFLSFPDMVCKASVSLTEQTCASVTGINENSD